MVMVQNVLGRTSSSNRCGTYKLSFLLLLLFYKSKMLELHCSNLTLLKNKSSILHFILNYFTMFSIVATEKKCFIYKQK